MRKKKPAGPQRAPVAVRLTEEMEKRLSKCAAKTKQSKHSLAIEAIEAAVEAIEENDYRLVVPIQFTVTHVPAEVGKREAPSARGGKHAADAGGRPSDSTVMPLPPGLNENDAPPAPRTTTDSPHYGSSKPPRAS